MGLYKTLEKEGTLIFHANTVLQIKKNTHYGVE
jgi:hypothetical protein